MLSILKGSKYAIPGEDYESFKVYIDKQLEKPYNIVKKGMRRVIQSIVLKNELYAIEMK
jgi:hypothetical protein